MGTTDRSRWRVAALGGAIALVAGGVGWLIGNAGADGSADGTVDVAVRSASTIRAESSTIPSPSTSISSTSVVRHHEDEPADRPTIVQFNGSERDELASQLATVREVALRYPTLADAAAAGFEPTTPYTPGLGAHMGRDDWTQAPGAPLDLTRPQSYLYDGTDPSSEVVGVMYVQLGGDTAPAGFAGPLDPWHAVRGNCLKPDEFDPLFPAADGVTEERCVAAGGRFIDVTAWTQHVWVVPGWEAPGGVFAAHNADIVCADGTTDSDPVTGCESPVTRSP